MSQLSEINDQKLSLRIKNGDKAAYQELYERYASGIFQFSISFLNNKADAEEILQDVFLKIWEKRETIDSTQNIKAYIFKIAVNKIYDFVRRKNLEMAFNEFLKTNFKRDENSTWHEVIYNEMLENLEKLIQQMPEQQQKIFRLNKEQGLTNEEIAKKLNLSKRTVENQLYRSVAFLKKHFTKNSVFSLLFFYLNVN